MRILFLGIAVPDMDSVQNLYTELLEEFHKAGHEVLVVAPVRENMSPGLRVEGGMQVLRISTLKLFNVGNIVKGLATVLLPYSYKRALKKSNIDLRFDLVIFPTPPITLTGLAKWLKNKYNAKVYLILRDIFPQNAVDLGMMKSGGIVHKYFRHGESVMYSTADKIGCMSERNRTFVLESEPGLDPSKLHLLPNWRPLHDSPSPDTKSQIIERYKLQDKFVVIFGGKIGPPQKLENIVSLARECVDIEDMMFLIVGDGSRKESIRKLVESSGLTNIKMVDGMSGPAYYEVLQVAHVGLIALSEDFTIPNIPSKALVYYNAKKPILAAIDTQTDMGEILESVGAGTWAKANDTIALKKKLVMLYENENLRQEMGQKGYDYLIAELSPLQAYEKIIREIGEFSD